MTGKTPLDKRAGLTLAELMIALIIGGMTLVITAQASSNVRRWTKRLSNAETYTSKTVGLYQFAETMLSDALPMTWTVDEAKRALFRGGEHDVMFVRSEPGYPSRAGIYQYHLYSVKQPDGEWAFMLSRELLTDPANFGTPKAPALLTLYRGEHAPVFAYSGDNGWQGQWTEQDTLPALIGFNIDDWPTLSIAIAQLAKPDKSDNEDKADDKEKNEKGKENTRAKAGSKTR
jgi:Prokaryotic N-terminal methylation motif